MQFVTHHFLVQKIQISICFRLLFLNIEQNIDKIMGNEQCLCCQQTKNQEYKDLPSIKVTTTIEPVSLPSISRVVEQHLKRYKPFQSQLPRNSIIKKFGNDTFQGLLNYKQKPDGFGTMYYKNGDVFIGQFQNGLANGPGHYVFLNGSYYHGTMYNNKAEAINGEYYSQQFVYRGGFKSNMFEGKGQQKSRYHEFRGQYHLHRKVNGTLLWYENQSSQNGNVTQKQLCYQGQFDEDGLFHGRGRLVNEYGQYKGQFYKGKKHGRGQFNFLSGVKYEGDYDKNIREGNGTLYSKTGIIAFSGQIRNGLPNGKGFVYNNFGDKVNLVWIDGLDQRLLQKN